MLTLLIIESQDQPFQQTQKNHSFTILIILMLVIYSSQTTKLVYQNSYENSRTIDWKHYQYENHGFFINQCGVQKILQIYSCSNYIYNTQISKSFFLESHTQITIQFLFWRLSFNNYDFIIQVDNQIVHQVIYNSTLTYLCSANANQNDIIQISIPVQHFEPLAVIQMKSNWGEWGMSNFQLFIDYDLSYCNLLIGEVQCDYYRVYPNSIYLALNLDGWLTDNLSSILVDNCLDFDYLRIDSNSVTIQLNLGYHDQISLSMFVMAFNSNPSQIEIWIDYRFVSNYMLAASQIQLLQQRCFNLQYMQINLINYQHSASTISIKIKSVLTSTQNPSWFGIKSFLLYQRIVTLHYRCYDFNNNHFDGCFSEIYDCVQGCSNCVKGVCLECQNGWEFNNFSQECDPICGDQKITQNEECDDGNLKPFDGCYFCKFSCPVNCLNCEYGKCVQCSAGYEWSNIQNQCVSFCNDNWQQLENEQCDDGNNIQFDGCYKCQLTCQRECQLCQNGLCMLCIEGWELINNQCLQFCGDSMIALISSEICDDGNNIYDDGCFECQLECSLNCLACQDKSKCIFCQSNFELVNNFCLPFCGDSIVISDYEDCDDGNNIPYDGCYECQFQCQQTCFTCESGVCLVPCQDGLEYIDRGCYISINDFDSQLINTCLSEGCLNCPQNYCVKCASGYFLENGFCLTCGNGIRQGNEQCDDGNNQNQDGCSELCVMEDLWNCTEIDTFYSQCFKITTPSIVYLNQTFNYQYVTLTYTNQVKLDISSFILLDEYSFSIDDLNPNQYKITLHPLIEIDQTKYKKIIYDIMIDIYQPIEFRPRLTYIFGAVLWDQHNLPVYPSQQSIELQIPKVLSKIQLKISNNFQSLGFGIMTSLMIVSILMILCREFVIFQEILDILQFQSFLKYINVNYPQNLYIYFESSDFVSITPFITNSNFGQFLGCYIEQIYVQSIGKFYQYQVNADLLTNLYCQIAQIMLALVILLFSFFYINFLYKYCFSDRLLINLRESNSILLQKLAIGIYNSIGQVLEYRKILTIQGIVQFYQTNSLDLIFKVVLYLNSPGSYGFRHNLSIFVSLTFLIISFIVVIRVQFQKLKGNQLNILQFETVVLIKKIMFISILILIQVQPILQCILLSFILSIYLCFLLANFKLDFDLITKMWMEIPVIFFILINLTFSDDFQLFITPSKSIYIGFFQIFLLILSLFAPISKLAVNLYNKYKFYRVKYNSKQTHQTSQLFIILRW